MSGALFPRIKNWGTTDTLIASDLNAEFDNILTNFKPQMIDAYSANVPQMQVQTAPGGVGTESLATSLSGEVERLRFQLAAITGNTYWYSSPVVTLAQLNTALGANTQANSITSGRIGANSSQPLFLVPSGSTNSVTLKATATPFVYKVAGSTVTIAADLTLTSLTVAPSSANTVTINDSTLAGSSATKLLGENGSTVTVTSMGASVSSLIGQIAAFKASGTEYVLCRVESTTQLTQVSRGYFFNQSDAIVSRTTVSNADTWTLLKLTWVYATSAGGGVVVYTNPKVGATAPSSPATGDYWYDTANNIWKTYNSTAFVAANATLIGVCVQDTTKTVGARSFDFFKAYADTNTVELIPENTTQIRSRYTDGQVSVYGTALQFPRDFIRWDTATFMDSGVTFSASTYYYMYLKENGDPVISDVAPFDRRADLKGYYHPANTWRCLGYAYSNASVNFSITSPVYEVESFFKAASPFPTVSKITAAVANYPSPFNVQFTQKIIECDATGGAFTQVLPHPALWAGTTLTYLKTDSTTNAVTLQAYGTSVLTTTANTAAASTSVTSLASTTGLTSGVTYYVSGLGIQPKTTATWPGSGTTVTLSQVPYVAITGTTLTFATGTNISGNFFAKLAMQYESVDLLSDGVNVFIKQRYIPSYTIDGGTMTIGAVTTAPTKGTVGTDRVSYYRMGRYMNASWRYNQSAAGSAGSGDYLVTIPGGWVIDTGIAPATTSASDLGTTDSLMPLQLVNASGRWHTGTPNGASNTISVTPYNTTQFRVWIDFSSGEGNWGSGTFNFGITSLTANINVLIPVLNWEA